MDLLTFNSLSSKFIFFAGAMSFVIALAELFVLKRRFENYIWAALLSSFGIYLFQAGFIINGMVIDYPLLFSFHSTLILFVGFFGSAGYSLIILQKEKLKTPGKFLLFYLPVAVSVILNIIFISKTGHERADYVKLLLYTGEDAVYTRLLFLWAGIQILFYQVYLFRKILKMIREGYTQGVAKVTLCYVIYTIVSTGFVLSGYLMGATLYIQIACLMMAILFLFTFFINLRHPKFLQLRLVVSEEIYSDRTYLSGVDIPKTIEGLKYILENEKLFKKEGLTLNELAGKLSISSHQLSELINVKLNNNFNNYINSYRVNYAREMLTEEPEKSVLEIAYESGFNSKTSFYEAFSKFIGRTPKQYRKENLK